MTPEALYKMAEENHWEVEWDGDGQIVLFTGVLDESKSQPPLQLPEDSGSLTHDPAEYELEELADLEEGIIDPYST